LQRLRFELRNHRSCRNRPSPLGCDAPFATVATGQVYQLRNIWNYLKGRRCINLLESTEIILHEGQFVEKHELKLLNI
jgi:hypothetical protein